VVIKWVTERTRKERRRGEVLVGHPERAKGEGTAASSETNGFGLGVQGRKTGKVPAFGSDKQGLEGFFDSRDRRAPSLVGGTDKGRGAGRALRNGLSSWPKPYKRMPGGISQEVHEGSQTGVKKLGRESRGSTEGKTEKARRGENLLNIEPAAIALPRECRKQSDGRTTHPQWGRDRQLYFYQSPLIKMTVTVTLTEKGYP